jgi:hypothetical protein
LCPLDPPTVFSVTGKADPQGGTPTYTVTVLRGQLGASQKTNRVYSETTGAPNYFAQVIFNEVDEG